MGDDDSVYQQIILDHYRNPAHRGLLDHHDVQVHRVNPTCGDEITLQVRFDGDVIAGLGWTGAGCSISQASMSMMSDLLIGRPVADALVTVGAFESLLDRSDPTAPDPADSALLADAVAFGGVARYPARVRCALLGWMAMRSALTRPRRPRPETGGAPA